MLLKLIMSDFVELSFMDTSKRFEKINVVISRYDWSISLALDDESHLMGRFGNKEIGLLNY